MIIQSSAVSMNAASKMARTVESKQETTISYHGDGFTNSTATTLSSITDELSESRAGLWYQSGRESAAEPQRFDTFTNRQKADEAEASETKAVGEDGTDKKTQKDTPQRLISQLSDGLKSFDLSDNPKIAALKNALKLIQRLTGVKGGMMSLSEAFGNNPLKTEGQSSDGFAIGQTLQSGGGASSASGYWTRKVDITRSVAETQSTSFQTTGTVNTKDGRTINFNVELELSQSFASEVKLTGEETNYVVTDPLVLNLKTDTAEVADYKFKFDLNADGTAEELSGLKSGSAFLALDKNKDGKINDGSELFGAKTGDGFAELAAYDEDGNGWIDEADGVYSSLSVWSVNEKGESELMALSKAGVGAIFLGSAKNDFTLRDSAGKESAYIRSTGMFLHENGEAGTVQHIDFIA